MISKNAALATAAIGAGLLGAAKPAEAAVLYDSLGGEIVTNVNGNPVGLPSSVDFSGQRFSGLSVIGDGNSLTSVEWLLVGNTSTAFANLNRVAIAFYQGGTSQFIASPDMTTATRLEQVFTNSGNISGHNSPIQQIGNRFIFHLKVSGLETFNIQTTSGQEHVIGYAVNGEFITGNSTPLVSGNFGQSRLYWNPGAGINPPKTYAQLNYPSNFDGVKVETVPEPATLAALAIGIGALASRRRKA